MTYTSIRIVDGKPRKVIVDENGKVINRNPSKDELKKLEICPKDDYKRNRPWNSYTDEELLNYLTQFHEKYERVPIRRDFANNPEYPSYETYRIRFGSFQKALILVGLDVDSMIEKGIIETTQQKGRLAEIKVVNHFKQHPIDLAGDNQNSPWDGICPNNQIYEVKSSKLYIGGFYNFRIYNRYKEEIEIYYLLGFNEDYTKLNHGWRIPGEIVETDCFIIKLGMYSRGYNIKNMKQYEITDKFRETLKK
jgi:hypothetical protein